VKVELSVLGLPEGVLNLEEISSRNNVSKGFILQLALGLSPLLYAIARLIAGIPILMLIYKRWKFRKNLIWK
jgi:hypothetical protein